MNSADLSPREDINVIVACE